MYCQIKWLIWILRLYHLVYSSPFSLYRVNDSPLNFTLSILKILSSKLFSSPSVELLFTLLWLFLKLCCHLFAHTIEQYSSSLTLCLYMWYALFWRAFNVSYHVKLGSYRKVWNEYKRRGEGLGIRILLVHFYDLILFFCQFSFVRERITCFFKVSIS